MKTRSVFDETFEIAINLMTLQGHVRVILMVSGWMTHEEDYKRSFGVIPDHLSLAVGIVVVFSCNCFINWM